MLPEEIVYTYKICALHLKSTENILDVGFNIRFPSILIDLTTPQFYFLLSWFCSQQLQSYSIITPNPVEKSIYPLYANKSPEIEPYWP